MHRRLLLRLFGARIGKGVVIKPGVRVKFPWRLEVGDHTWIGERAWLDNLAPISVAENCCISQEAYLCTGSHVWTSASFDLIVRPIRVNAQAWIAARAIVAPGVVVGEGAVLALGSIAAHDLDPWTIYSGTPAKPRGRRMVAAPATAPAVGTAKT
jgi:putative colanic acid biosynthesis acetyltransferase WcaF